MSNDKTEGERTGATRIYEQISEYCRARTEGIGGHYGQEPYKGDFFRIFIDAYTKRLCGREARHRYEKRRKELKKKRINSSDYDISGEAIKMYLELNVHSVKNHLEIARMVETLCVWWDAWVYAWERHPGSLPPKWKIKLEHPLDEYRMLVYDVFSSPNLSQ